MDKSTWPFKHNITKTKVHNIISIGQQVNNSLQLGSITRKQATVQANQTEHSEIVLSIFKKKSEIKWDFGQLSKTCPTTLFSLIDHQDTPHL